MVGCVLNPDPSEGLQRASARPRRRVLVPAVREARRARRPRARALDAVRLAARALHPALHQRGERRHHLVAAIARLPRLPDAQAGDLPRRRLDSLPDRPLPLVLPAPSAPRAGRAVRTEPAPPSTSTHASIRRRRWSCLFKVVGPDRCLFGAERPGTGSEKDPDTGRWFDDIKPLIDDINALTDADAPADLRGQRQEAPQPRLALARTLG